MSASGKPTRAQIQNPSTHYGKARASTRHFITQRITGAINIVFALFIIWFVVSLAGRAPAEMIELARNPFVAIGLALLVVNVSIHMRNGMRDVIDLSDADQARLALESAQAARALKDMTRCTKLNVAALGNTVPQLHVHVIARFSDDAAWPRPVWGVVPAKPYADAALAEFIGQLKRLLALG